jgi:ketosteroid isomerase-like protein
MNEEEQIVALFEDGDRALMTADVAEIRRVYAEEYVQYDESGNPSTSQDLIDKLLSGKVRFIAMKSTGRRIRWFGDFAVVHGSEEDLVEQDGNRSAVRYVYTDVVVKRDGRWQIVASQLARPR